MLILCTLKSFCCQVKLVETLREYGARYHEERKRAKQERREERRRAKKEKKAREEEERKAKEEEERKAKETAARTDL
jgi:hypothetical protein